MKLNISTKLQLLVAAFGLATFVIVAGAYLLIDAKSADGLQINLAGRQRMLSQRMSKEALSLASAETSARKQAAGTLAKTVELFDKTLIALHKGGTTKGGDGKPVQLPAAEGSEVQSALKSGASLWAELETGLRGLATGRLDVDSDAGKAALASLQGKNLELLKRMNSVTMAFQKASDEKLGTLNLLLGLGLGAVSVLVLWSFFAIRKEIIGPIQEIAKRFHEVASGDGGLDQQVPEHDRDELGKLGTDFNLFLGKLRGTMADVHGSSEHISRSSQEILSSADALSQASSGQAASLEEIRAALGEVEERNRTNSQSVREASEFSQEANSDATSGQEHVSRMTEVMGEIKSSSEEITRVIQVIDEIAFQTNLLALNAAVEAARAGEAGKGFAVVAEEVRSLAHRSAEAARSSGEMIRSAVDRVGVGNGVAEQVKEVFERILGGSERMQHLLGKITESDASVAQGMDQISGGLADLDGQAQTTAAQSEQLSAASRSGQDQVDKLMSLVEQFQAGGGSATSSKPSTPSTPPKTSSPAQPRSSTSPSTSTNPAQNDKASKLAAKKAEKEARAKAKQEARDAKAAAKKAKADQKRAAASKPPSSSGRPAATKPAVSSEAKKPEPPKPAPKKPEPPKPNVDDMPSLDLNKTKAAAPAAPVQAAADDPAPPAKRVDTFLPFDDDDDDDDDGDWGSF
jgi:methyl-accepting chemotaxis protein